MGTVAIYRHVRIVIYSRDHEPPHVHAIAPNAEAVFNLKNFELVRLSGFNSKSVEKIRLFLQSRKGELWEAWHEIDGKEKN